jgi:hypothetical protein
VTGPSANNGYNNILAKLGWPIKNGELSSQLAGQQWVKSLKGLRSFPENFSDQTLFGSLKKYMFLIPMCMVIMTLMSPSCPVHLFIDLQAS